MLLLSVFMVVFIFAMQGQIEPVTAETNIGDPTIFDNGGLTTGTMSNSGTTAPAGTEWSEVQNETGNTTYSNTLSGVSCSVTTTVFRCADDFTVPPGETWTINQVVTFAYQTGFAGGTSPITAATLQIWDGVPGEAGSNIIFGDETTNRLSSTGDTSLYRIFNSAVPAPGTTPGTTRRVWSSNINVSPAAVLPAGTYWVDWNTQIGATTAHFAPPVTIPGVRNVAGMNARQRVAAAVWQAVIDVGNPDASAPDLPLDFPFQLRGSIAGGPSGAAPPFDFDGDGKSDYSIVRDTTPAPTGSIPGTGTGPIPDRGATGCGLPAGPNLDVSFDGSGLSGPITNVSIDIDATHTWVGDLDAKLIAPDNTEHVLFGGTNSTTATGCGSSGDLTGLYTFNNAATGDWWAFPSANIPVGSYRTTSAGDVVGGGVATDMNAAFAGANPTGTWILRVTDSGGGDTGSINSASLTVTTASTLAPSGRRSIQSLQAEPGFKPLPGASRDNLGATPGSNLSWYISNSGSGTFEISGFGAPATDFWVPSDYDGDGKADIAVWRGVAAGGPNGAYLHVFNSSTSTISTVDFGQQGDNPTMIGDYDGDGSADPAVYRCPSGGGQCTFFYKGSAGGGEITYFDWGNSASGQIRPYPGDFDGDGKSDFCIYQGGQYILNRSSDNGVEYITFGGATDPIIAPGDYDGDGKTDFMNVLVSGTDIQWWLLERDGPVSVTTWGAIIPGFAEFATPGDYDGDGKTDIGIWRRDNSSNDNSFFYTLRSSDGMLETFEWGSMGDAPVPGWNDN